jgi:hypothetical protein
VPISPSAATYHVHSIAEQISSIQWAAPSAGMPSIDRICPSILLVTSKILTRVELTSESSRSAQRRPTNLWTSAATISVMDTEDVRSFIDSDMGKAFDALLTLTSNALELTAATQFAFPYVVRSIDEHSWRLANDMFGVAAAKLYDACKSTIDSQFHTLHAFCLLGAWGAFEDYVEAAAKAALRGRPELVYDNPAFDRATRRASTLPDLTEDERFERIISVVVSNKRNPLDAAGCGKYESQLELGDINGPIPTDLAEALMEGQQVRNILAHNGGRADAKLLQQAHGLGYAIGDEVKITKAQLGKYLVALNTYTTIILNRHRVQNGFTPLVCYQGDRNMFKAGFDALYPGAILPVNLRDLSQSESGDHS